MKQLSRLICILICVLIPLSAAVVSASDYEGHWAAGAIDTLRGKGIVSGDSDGNMYPDAAITRAEFVKVVNRTFGFSVQAEENFSDVPADAWYAGEFKIAKHQGYLTGDQNQHANPEAEITRAEVSVILTRILNLNRNVSAPAFDDPIPDWAREYVNAMTAVGYLAGYPDGSFRAEASITRGEAFTVIERILEKQGSSPNPNGNIASIPSGGHISTGGSSGGGGGGGGGGSTSSGGLSSPLISKYDKETNTVYFAQVSGATGYVLRLSSPELAKEHNISYTEDGSKNYKSDIQTYLDSFFAESEYPVFDCEISLQAVSGSKKSDFSKVTTLSVSLPALPAPELIQYYEKVGDNTNVVITWNEVENAASYQILFQVNGAENKSYIYKAEERTLIIPAYQNLVGKSLFLGIRAVSQDPEWKSSVYATVGFGGLDIAGEGTEENPYVIRTKEDFEKIRENPEAHYVLLNDIDLGNYTPIPTFSGSLRSSSADTRATVTVNIQQSSNNAGLFGTLTEGGTVENIAVLGSVSGVQNVGAIAGNLNGEATVKNCVNYAQISGERNVGGISGYTSGDSLCMEQCYNYGSVTSTSSNVGGIGGYYNSFILTKCGNYGDITGASNVGGILGAAYCGVTDSFNAGTVSSSGSAGGICGTLQRGWTVESCYNVGTVATSASTAAGGINGTLTRLDSAASNCRIQYCYNAGAVTGTNAFQISLEGDTLDWQNCYYVSDTADSKSFGTNVSASDFTNPENEHTAALLQQNNPDAHFEMNEADENVYPSIVGNPQLRVSDTVKFQLTNLSAVKVERTVEEEGGAKTVYDLRFTWENSGTAAQPLSYVVTDKESYQSIEEGTLTEGAVEFVLEDVANNKYYEFKVICSDNGREYTAGALTADTVAPRQATNLSVAVEQQTFTVSFDPPADDDYAGAEIYLDGELAGKIAAGVQSFKISDLKGEKTYTIGVVAVDSFGNRSEEAAVTATTQRKDFYGEWLQDTDLESPGVTIIEITE